MYLRSKKVKSKSGETYEYEQLVESYRAGGKSRQKVVMTLGKKGEVTGERVEEIIRTLMKKNPTLELVRQFDRKTPDLKIHSSKELGAYVVFRHLWEKIGLQTAVEAIAPGGKEKEFAEMIFLLILYRILSPGSERRMANIFEPKVYHRLKRVPALNEWYRAISRLQKNRSSVEDEAYRRIEGMFPGKMSLMYFDTTSLVLFGDYRKSEIARFGMSKDKRSDKKQVVVGMVLNAHGLPVGITEENGNAVDVKNFISMLKKMKKKYGVSQMIFVGDKGMNSKANREILVKDHQQYILGVRAGIEKKVSEEILKNDFEWTNAPKLEYSKNQQKLVMQLKNREDENIGDEDFHTRVVERSLDGRRMIFFFNPLEKHAEETKRDQIIRALEKKVKTISGLKQLIGNKGYRSLLTFGSVKKERKKENKEQPVTVVIDHQKIERMKSFDGITVVETNTDLPAPEVVKQYKQLITVEQSFSDLKSTMECRPIYHKTDTNIRGHIFINFLALLLYYLFFHLLSGHFEESSRYEIIQALKDIQAHEVEQNGRRYLVRTELTPIFQNICSILKLKPSPRILGTL